MVDLKMQLTNKLLKSIAKIWLSNYNILQHILHENPFRNNKYLYNIEY